MSASPGEAQQQGALMADLDEKLTQSSGALVITDLPTIEVYLAGSEG